MTRKRIASIAAVLVLLSVLTTSAFASTVVTADLLLPDIIIDVTVPGGSETVMNPLGLSVVIDGEIEDGQIISLPAYIENNSEAPILVSVSVTGVEKGGLDLRSSTTQGSTSKSKRAFVYFQLRAADDPDNVSWGDSYDADRDIVVRTSTKKKTDYVTLAADGQNGRFGVFRLAGDCIAEPKTPWSEEDGFAATIVFSFKLAPLD